MGRDRRLQLVTAPPVDLNAQLAALVRPRKYYQQYFATREANGNMLDAPQGLQAFLSAYFHYKSADWKGNTPFALEARTGEELAKMPTYYVMDLDKGIGRNGRTGNAFCRGDGKVQMADRRRIRRIHR
jgi:hypothetical protein